MKHQIFALVSAIVFMSGCTATTPLSVTKTVDRTFAVAGGSSSGGSQLAVAAQAYKQDGKVMVCAAAGADGNMTFTSDWPAALLRASTIYVGDDRILSGLDFGAIYVADAVLVGKVANCTLTDKAWKSEYDRARPSVKVGQVQLTA